MLLKRIKYNNFRPFIGEQEVVLIPSSENADKNVVVILGDNTYGKSTFVLSFIWCLYGESKFTRKDDILNKKVEAGLTYGHGAEASVEIEFEDDNKVYTMVRKQRFSVGQNGKLNADRSYASLTYVAEDGQTKSCGSSQALIQEIITSIMPKDLSAFFFFEGEKNNEINRKDLGTAVRTLLGLEAYDKLRTHLYGSQLQNSPAPTSVMGYFREKMNDESGEKAKYEYDKMIKAQEAIDALIEEIEEINGNIAFYEESIEKINAELREAGPTKEKQKRRDGIAKELKLLEEDLKRYNSKLLATFSRDSLPLFITPFLAKVSTRLTEMDVADKGIKGIEAPAIYELLRRGVCLCGTDLKEGTLAYKNVEKYIDYIPPKSVGTLVRDMFEAIDSNEEKAKKFADDFEEIYLEIQRCKVRIDELEEEDRILLFEITSTGAVNTDDAENNLASYKRRLIQLRDELRSKESEKTRKDSERETAENNFNMYRSKNSKAQEYQVYYQYAEALYNWVNSNYSKKENEMRERLNTYVSELFNNMYTGNRDIYIDEKYNINMTVNGNIVDDTGGLRVIQYFAYVGGLVKLAFEVMSERDEDENENVLGEQYPLVLDAAFSHADKKHTKNISRELALATKQLVFAVMEKDWLHAQEGLVGKVARLYELKKIDETEVRIVEVK